MKFLNIKFVFVSLIILFFNCNNSKNNSDVLIDSLSTTNYSCNTISINNKNYRFLKDLLIKSREEFSNDSMVLLYYKTILNGLQVRNINLNEYMIKVVDSFPNKLNLEQDPIIFLYDQNLIYIRKNLIFRLYNHIGAKYLEEGIFDRDWPNSQVPGFWNLYRKFNKIDQNYNFISMMDLLKYDYTYHTFKYTGERLKKCLEYLFLHEIYHTIDTRKDSTIEFRADSFAIIQLLESNSKYNLDFVNLRSTYKDIMTVMDFVADVKTRTLSLITEDGYVGRHANVLNCFINNYDKITKKYRLFQEPFISKADLYLLMNQFNESEIFINSLLGNLKILKPLTKSVNLEDQFMVESFEFTISNYLEQNDFIGLKIFLTSSMQEIKKIEYNKFGIAELSNLVLAKIYNCEGDNINEKEAYIVSKQTEFYLTNKIKDLIISKL